MKFRDFWHKYNAIITSISIILFIIFSVTMIVKDHNLKLEINENCGWGEDDYECYCEKSEAIGIKNKLEGETNFTFDLGGKDVDS